MPQNQKKNRRNRRPRKKLAVDAYSEEAFARGVERDAISRKRELVLQRMNEIFAKRKADRATRKEAVRGAGIKLHNKEIENQIETAQEEKMIQIRKDMKSILVAGAEEVNALKVIGKKARLDGSTMTIGGSKYKLKKNVHMVGWGRETLMLGAAFEKLIGNHLKRGFLVVPRGSISGMWDNPLWFPTLNTRITYFESGSSNSPDERSVAATRRIADYCKKLRKSDILVVVLSGGAEDLLSCPREGTGLAESEDVVRQLRNAGATPAEINNARCKLSAVFGGELARLAYPAKVITLAMSDIPGDPVHLIAGGPTVNNPGRDAVSSVLKKYKLEGSVPPGVALALSERRPSEDPLVDESRNFKFVDYHIVGSTADALRGMADAAFRLGLVPVVLSSAVAGNVREVSQAYVRIATLMILATEGKIGKVDMYEDMKSDPVLPLSEELVEAIFPSRDKWGLGLCLLLGGIPTSFATQPGRRTGPSQELALYFSLDWYRKVRENPILKEYVVWFLGGSTSGVDGNTRAAGAYGYGSLGPAVYKRHKRLIEEEARLALRIPGLLRTNPESGETREALERRSVLRDEIERIAAILPDRVLREGCVNSFFTSVNDGDELLDLGYTYTGVCDLHVVRIARYQCSCDGRCQARGENDSQLKTICRDAKCVANRTPPVVPTHASLGTRCCSRLAAPKDKILS